MERTPISTDAAPAAIGPYSQAIRAGNLIFVSGQLPINPATGELITDDIGAMTRQIFANIAAILQAAGSSLDRIVKTTVFLADLNDFAAMNASYAEHFGDAPPARSTVQVARLPRDARIEIEVIALA
ncbi:MAG TPA: RidA family protein [Chloroflexus aurantiacus]|jgi:2-iminobutanoate/2-iminopropanoate deaminase|uniref:Endoribonuclease L-PSP n=1 Tax=Chloroflexus aurantiacus (strain ATCC 29366 / DSM 635 / J-10-fl) TaxID=324602 RepID=A9WBW1_CHLAA|nr:RidA family protein [Chloroflexus aurantiacus]ABY36913.1 endoribonuclease L-PSP [Chloroflexus aurantiacus J-10-fl]RMG50601.1 MAG: RidA family protein [Chloroflexota bacterium]HBW68398.1 RidA family protein [Chloroflexus aurantiacus]